MSLNNMIYIRNTFNFMTFDMIVFIKEAGVRSEKSDFRSQN